MIFLPAIDVRGGKCVRLLQGRNDAVTVYGDDPLAVAAGWVAQGASWLHLVNLDGAFGRASGNLDVAARLVREAGASVEFGGGIRSLDDIAWAIGTGVRKVVLGTIAFEDEALLSAALDRFGEEKVVVAVDAREGSVTTRGWTRPTGIPVVQAAARLEALGVRELLYTDVSRDGMLSGPDLVTLRRLVEETGVRVVASGGVSSLDDLKSLAALNLPRLSGVIVGKALYEGKFTVSDALKLGFT